MNNLDQLLEKQQYNYGSNFSKKVLLATKAIKDHSPGLHWFLLGAAASIFLCVLSTYLLEGQLSLDSFLGTEGLYNDTLNEYINIQ
jgi:hypothetical protein